MDTGGVLYVQGENTLSDYRIIFSAKLAAKNTGYDKMMEKMVESFIFIDTLDKETERKYY
ncbi:MAG: hypothetical protein LUF27_07675 [Lachnospiraceae bacterium]|nr:hypothetical protein [Lachnospiraceae bacterium]